MSSKPHRPSHKSLSRPSSPPQCQPPADNNLLELCLMSLQCPLYEGGMVEIEDNDPASLSHPRPQSEKDRVDFRRQMMFLYSKQPTNIKNTEEIIVSNHIEINTVNCAYVMRPISKDSDLYKKIIKRTGNIAVDSDCISIDLRDIVTFLRTKTGTLTYAFLLFQLMTIEQRCLHYLSPRGFYNQIFSPLYQASPCRAALKAKHLTTKDDLELINCQRSYCEVVRQLSPALQPTSYSAAAAASKILVKPSTSPCGDTNLAVPIAPKSRSHPPVTISAVALIRALHRIVTGDPHQIFSDFTKFRSRIQLMYPAPEAEGPMSYGFLQRCRLMLEGLVALVPLGYIM